VDSYRNQARVAGVLYIIATAAIVASGPLVGSTDSLGFLTDAAADEGQVMAGTLLQLAWVLSVMFIPVVLYPTLKLQSETGALGFFSLRFTEALLSVAYVLIQLAMLSLSKEFVGGSGVLSDFEATGTALLEARDWAFALGAGFAFNLSALLLNYLLYRSRLVPRWLSAWGFLGAALWMVMWFPQVYDVELGVLEVSFLPIAVQEMVFAVYLLVRGFDTKALGELTTPPTHHGEPTAVTCSTRCDDHPEDPDR
jgi:hypothetical protein